MKLILMVLIVVTGRFVLASEGGDPGSDVASCGEKYSLYSEADMYLSLNGVQGANVKKTADELHYEYAKFSVNSFGSQLVAEFQLETPHRRIYSGHRILGLAATLMIDGKRLACVETYNGTYP